MFSRNSFTEGMYLAWIFLKHFWWIYLIPFFIVFFAPGIHNGWACLRDGLFNGCVGE